MVTVINNRILIPDNVTLSVSDRKLRFKLENVLEPRGSRMMPPPGLQI